MASEAAAEKAVQLLQANAPYLKFFACQLFGLSSSGYDDHVRHAFGELARTDGRRLLGHGRASDIKPGKCKLCYSEENSAMLHGSVVTNSS
jgi:hypothetical protein